MFVTYDALTVGILYLFPLVLRFCCMVLHNINTVLQLCTKKLILPAFCNLGHTNTLLLPKFCTVMKQVYRIGDYCAFSLAVCDVSTLGSYVLAGTCTGAPSWACGRSTGRSVVDRGECGMQAVVIVKGSACISY